MRHRKHTFKVGRRSDHVKALLANMTSSLILEGRIRTTITKAKEVRRMAERMVTLGKKGTLHHRRLAISRIRHKDAVHKLFAEVAPRYMDRDGGYTRIIRLGTRAGDASEMCFLEWVEAGPPARNVSPVKERAVETFEAETTEPEAEVVEVAAEEPAAEADEAAEKKQD